MSTSSPFIRAGVQKWDEKNSFHLNIKKNKDCKALKEFSALHTTLLFLPSSISQSRVTRYYAQFFKISVLKKKYRFQGHPASVEKYDSWEKFEIFFSPNLSRLLMLCCVWELSFFLSIHNIHPSHNPYTTLSYAFDTVYIWWTLSFFELI